MEKFRDGFPPFRDWFGILGVVSHLHQKLPRGPDGVTKSVIIKIISLPQSVKNQLTRGNFLDRRIAPSAPPMPMNFPMKEEGSVAVVWVVQRSDEQS